MVRKKVFPDLIAHTALVDGLCRNGNVGLAFKELDEMKKKMNCTLNLVLHGSLTYGLCSEGRADEAKMLLEEMGMHH
ncbi:Pentatricopeptide repeat-containing protein [Cynara cardunculus var. scolymus]|uniref:Pentatricopeptide repeat-containing protein n=1 Tax=Cynara cardunculus var. scolymus TaxID=59895 RepID=A0A103XRL7_CYNCS|nr:Pentatricopeptide repeat-containing protein [Cynara cardunculus var. scolymus]